MTAVLLADEPVLVSSDLARTELRRVARRVAPYRLDRVREVLAAVTTVRLTAAICDAAGRLDPPTQRSLDALHLATALEFRDDLDEVVSYDDRQAEGARALGLAVFAPA